MSDAGALIGGVIAIFIAIVLVWAFFPVMVQLAGIGYALLFVAAAAIMIIGAAVGLGRN